MRKTEDIIEQLASGLKPVPALALERRLALAVLPALGVSLLLMLATLGPRVDMHDALTELGFWIKSAYNALLALTAFFAVGRLTRPEGNSGCLFVWLAVIFVVMAAIALVQSGVCLSGQLQDACSGVVRAALPVFDRRFRASGIPGEFFSSQTLSPG